MVKTQIVVGLCGALLCVSPLFAGEFHVKDFGAVGDGRTDDGPAIRRAVAAAAASAPGAKVVFENKRYRLARAELEYHIDLVGVTGLTLEGHGAELINNPWNNLVKLEDCDDVTVRGFVFDCDPLPFTQGVITGVDAGAGTFLLKIQDGYDNPVEVYRRIGKQSPDWGWGACFDPVERRRKDGAAMHFYLEDVSEQPGGLLRVKLAEKNRMNAGELQPGDRFVVTLKYGGHGANIAVVRSANCHLENNTFYTAKFGMTHGLFDNRGRIFINNVKITYKPGSDRLVTTPKDGFHCKHNAVGPVIENGHYEGLMDDSINISVCPYWVRQDLGDNRYLIAELQFLPRVGDRLMAYRPKPGTITDGLTVTAIEPQPAPEGMQGRWAVVTLNKPIPDPGLHTGGNLFPGGVDKLDFTGLYNTDASGRDYIVRGNTFGPQRRHAVMARTSGGLIEDNIINGVGGCGVTLCNEIGSFYEGPLPSDTIIRNNTFTDTFFNSIDIYVKGRGAVAHNITITGNHVTGWHTSPMNRQSAAAISMRNVNGAVIRDNTIGPAAAQADNSQPLRLENCTDIEQSGNEIRADPSR
ncbi:MAG: hypothetical protein GC164_15075 [Phycisphaera sp.]|nr:hypothetical protein [Phycisphaera sp.]